MDVKIEPSWQRQLENEFSKEYFQKLVDFVKTEYSKYTIYPPGREIFAAFDKCTYDSVKVVIIGQDPYHGPRQAHGLCFSVRDGVKIPPSLQNIYKELKTDLDKEIPSTGNIDYWAKQGVLLLNATLTVRARTPGSHQNKGWEKFTDAVIELLSDNKNNLVFILWGAYAQRKGAIIDKSRHLVIESAHPSPFSADRGFFGSRPFSRTNDYLIRHNQKGIDWELTGSIAN